MGIQAAPNIKILPSTQPGQNDTWKFQRNRIAIVMKFRDRLSYKQARNTVAIAFFLGLTLSLLQVLLDYLSQDRRIDDTIQTYIHITKTPAARIAYNIDNELATELVNGLIESPMILHAEILDPDGIPLAVVTRSPEKNPDYAYTDSLFGSTRTYIQELRVPYDEDEELGWLKIIADTRPMGQQFMERALYTLGSGLLRTFILSLALLTMFYIMLTKPLLKLTRNLSSESIDDKEHSLPIIKGHEHDEIGLLNDTLNHYKNKIDVHLHHRSAAESELRTHLKELENIIAQRTSELRRNNKALATSNRALEKARRKAMNAARIRGNQLSSLSHEIRTPLNGILGMLNLALDESLPDPQRKRLSIARSSGVQLVKLLNDMLDLSKIESGKINLESIPFNLKDVVEEATVLVAQTAHSKGISVICDIDPKLPELLMGDPIRITQIISNVLNNAAKFTHEGEIVVYLTALGLDESNLEIIIKISDTGIGIPTSALDEIFKPFAQASNETSRIYGGSGMGLSLTRQIIEAMQGQINVDSLPGEGSTFTVHLPLRRVDQKTLPDMFKPMSKYNILIACSLRLNLALSRVMEHWHAHFKISSPQPLLIEAPEFEDFDLIITDDKELAFRINKTKPLRKIILTAYQHQHELPENIDWLPLPIRQSLLLNSCYQCLDIQAEPLEQTETDIEQPSETGDVVHVTDHKILIVEDNPINRMVAAGMLEQLGYQSELAQNGQECLTACNNQSYDLILMDCNMPVMDGYSATRRLRSMTNTRDIPIIALTANALAEHKKSCLDAGMNDYLAKPFDKRDLMNIIERWLPENTV